MPKKMQNLRAKKLKAIGLAVFIDYKKELSILTKDIHTKKLSSPIAWGWEYSYEDPVKIKGFSKNKTVFGGFDAIRNCYLDVRKKKIKFKRRRMYSSRYEKNYGGRSISCNLV